MNQMIARVGNLEVEGTPKQIERLLSVKLRSLLVGGYQAEEPVTIVKGKRKNRRWKKDELLVLKKCMGKHMKAEQVAKMVGRPVPATKLAMWKLLKGIYKVK